jgi:putative transposase
MKKSRFSEEKIVRILNDAAAGRKVVDICRENGISDVTFYKWRSKYGGLSVSDLKRLNQLEIENQQLKKLLADTMLDKQALQDLLTKKF